MTVPVLITKYQKEQTVTRLKKAYSALSQTTNLAIADYGPLKSWEVGPDSYDPNDIKIFLNKYITPYLSIMKQPTASNEGHWDSKWYYLNGSQLISGGVRFFLNDGTSITATHIFNTENNKRLLIRVDINGDKKPNKFGRDIFELNYWILSSNDKLNGKMVFWGHNQSRDSLLSHDQYNCNKQDTGAGCGALIQKDGWRIADDYPW